MNAFNLSKVAFSLALLTVVGLPIDYAFAQNISTAWYAGKLYVPAALSTKGSACESIPFGKCVMEIKPGKHPVIIFLHGCGGPNPLTPFLELGAIVVAPDSFARGVTCSDWADKRYMTEFIKIRYAELSYAEDKIKAAAWADPDKMLLAGFSHGALMTAIYPGTEFKARVIISWTCTDPLTAGNNGVRGSEPVLSILGTADEVLRKIGISGNCGEALKGHGEDSQSILIEGGVHEILDHPSTREAVAKFIPLIIR